jgi:hypothetical protein
MLDKYFLRVTDELEKLVVFNLYLCRDLSLKHTGHGFGQQKKMSCHFGGLNQ